MAVYRRSARPRFTLLLLVLTSITLLTLDERGAGFLDSVRDGARDAFAPVQEAADAVFEPVGDAIQGAFNYNDIEAENARLREQLAEREGQALRAADAEREREALLDLQKLDFSGDIPAVAARVVSAPASNFELTVAIDRGRSHGVGKGMPVVSGAGLVGRILRASRTRAIVLLITDPSSQIGVRMASDDVGIAVGRGPGSTLRVDLIEALTKVAVGEAVVTSGLQQSLFPPGLPVGRVRAAKTAAGALHQDVTVEPLVDFGRLTYLKVLQWSPR